MQLFSVCGGVTAAVWKVGPDSSVRRREFEVECVRVWRSSEWWRAVGSAAFTRRRRVERQRRARVIGREQTLERLACGLFARDTNGLTAG